MKRDKPITPVRIYQAVVQSPIPGASYLGIRIEKGVLTTIDFLSDDASPIAPLNPTAQDVVTLLDYYFRDGHSVIATLQPTGGTPFQQRVWQQLQQIPPGECRRYGEIATRLGSGARAVAGACRANPLPILIPCHRVIAADGPGGYMGQTAGAGLAIKRWLLHHEGYV